ncbi:cellulase, partial [Bacillus cereus]|nr:cellulase [Bacillus cereus]MEC2858513.1 cellulase [Bacillus cereus]
MENCHIPVTKQRYVMCVKYKEKEGKVV